MFEIKLYTFDKKPNSTKRPNINAGMVFNCDIKTPSSIYAPVIDIKTNSNNVPRYNYAYISEFRRYYFITNTVYNLGTWTMSLAVDLLASFKNDIFNSRQYVVRSASASNEYIIDTLYRTYRDDDTALFWKSDPITTVERLKSTDNTWVSVSPFNQNVEDGYFMVGVVGSTNTGVTYYIMGCSEFQIFLQKAFTTVPSGMTDVDTGTASAIYNAVQYITVCRWYPVKPLMWNAGTYTRYVSIGSLTIDLGYADADCIVMNGITIEQYRTSIDIPTHPQYSSDLKYLRYSPYTELGLYMQPFGTIPIDTTRLVGSDRLQIYWYVDYCAGCATLEIRNNATNNHMLVATATAEYGVPIPVSTLVYDWKGALAMGAANFIKTAIENEGQGFLGIQFTGNTVNGKEQATIPYGVYGSSMAGNIAADIARGVRATSQQLKADGNLDLLNTAINIAGASMGQISTVGAQGSFLAYNMDMPYLYAWFSKIADTDPDRFGYPLCKKKRIDQLSGYCLCLDATVDYTDNVPLAVEAQGIATMLNTGVFIE